MRRSLISAAFLPGLLSGIATPALACTPLIVIGMEEIVPSRAEQARIREDCRLLDLRRERIARSARLGHLDNAEVLEMARKFESEDYGCPGDARFAFDLVEKATPAPVTVATDPALIGWLYARLGANRDRISAERFRNLVAMRWLLSPDAFSTPPESAEGIFADPANRAFAIENLGAWQRDHALLSYLSDTTSPDFDRDLFLDLLDRHQAMGTRPAGAFLVHGARLLLDPAHGEPDVARARQMLGRVAYSPYIAGPSNNEAAALWRTIGQNLLASPDEADRQFAEGLLATGDPHHPLRVALPMPEGARLIDVWPESFGPTPLWERAAERLGTHFPARALRMEEAGPVETALHYGPDGRFLGVIVTRTSGSAALDNAAREGWTRYLRPRPPSQLPAILASGADLLIRLPTIEYHIVEEGEQPPVAGMSDGRIVVNGSIRTIDEGCQR